MTSHLITWLYLLTDGCSSKQYHRYDNTLVTSCIYTRIIHWTVIITLGACKGSLSSDREDLMFADVIIK